MFDRLLNTREVAERLHVSRSYVYYLIEQGELRAVRIRRLVRIRPDELERYIADRERLRKMVLGSGPVQPAPSTKARRLDWLRRTPFDNNKPSR